MANGVSSQVLQAATEIRKRSGREQFSTAVILGSGLGAVGGRVQSSGGVQISYGDIPHMPQPQVAGHSGSLVIGSDQHADCLFLRGRVHWYEGHSLNRMLFATKVACELGIKRLVVTNAAGGIRAGFQPGDLMVLNGHATFLPIAESPDDTNTQSHAFQVAKRLWNSEMRGLAATIETSLNIHEGVYAMMAGPNYETPAEVKMLQFLGVDAVGMSTVPEAVAAANRGVSVMGISCITNVASGLSTQPLDHAEVSETANSVEEEFSDWMLRLLPAMSATARDQ